MFEEEIAVKVDNLTKSFNIPLETHSGLKQSMINTLKGRKGYREFTPIKNISFEIKKGEFFGIVGRNGSGKSTLLKTLAGIYAPNEEGVHINGSLVPFIELGVGFNPELTGRENVFLNGALLGFSRKKMENMYDDIVDFAELHEFMEERLKNYSSGMQVRLAFSIAIRAEADILLLDEVLAVGDTAFQKKCRDYFRTIKNKKKTVILVTHDMQSVEDFCDSAMLIEDGKIQYIGKPKKVTELYDKSNLKQIEQSIENEETPSEDDHEEDQSHIVNGAKIKSFRIVNSNNKDKKAFRYHEDITVEVSYVLTRDLKNMVFDVGFTLGEGGQTYMYGDTKDSPEQGKSGSLYTVKFSVKNVLAEGTYHVITSIFNPDTLEVYSRDRNLAKFIVDKSLTPGVIAQDYKITLEKG